LKLKSSRTSTTTATTKHQTSNNCNYNKTTTATTKNTLATLKHNFLTFSPHSHLEAFLESAMLALVSMVLINRTVFASTTLIR